MSHSNTRLAALGFAGLALAACTQNGEVDTSFTTASIAGSGGQLPQNIARSNPQAHTLSRKVAVSESFASFPMSDARIVSVSERQYANGLVQTISLSAAPSVVGTNFLKVGIVQLGRNPAPENRLDLDAPSGRTIQSEMRREFTDANMQINALVPRNAYGIYGMAHGGAANGVRCHYGWQIMDGAVSANRLATAFSNKGQKRLSLRVRLCQPGLSVAGFQSYMDNLELSVPVNALDRRLAHEWKALGSKTLATAPSSTGYVIDTPLDGDALNTPALGKNPKVLKKPVKAKVTKSVDKKKSVANVIVPNPSADGLDRRSKQITNPDDYALVPLPQ